MKPKSAYRRDFLNERFGRLVVLAEASRRRIPSGGLRRYLICRCDCGTTKEIAALHLTTDGIQSCGCYRLERVRSSIRHGEGRKGALTPEYKCWLSIRKRCEDSNQKSYPHYGGRGISVCARWRHGENEQSAYQCFLSDMGRKPSPNHSLDRIDNDLGYEPNNCRWATRQEQMKNRRRFDHAAMNAELVRLLGRARELYGSAKEHQEFWLEVDAALQRKPRVLKKGSSA